EVDELEQQRHRDRVVPVLKHALDVDAPVVLDATERACVNVRGTFQDRVVKDPAIVRVVSPPRVERNADTTAIDEPQPQRSRGNCIAGRSGGCRQRIGWPGSNPDVIHTLEGECGDESSGGGERGDQEWCSNRHSARRNDRVGYIVYRAVMLPREDG